MPQSFFTIATIGSTLHVQDYFFEAVHTQAFYRYAVEHLYFSSVVYAM